MDSSTAKTRMKELGSFWAKHGPAILAYGLVPVPSDSMGIGANSYRACGKFVKREAGDKPLNKPENLFSGWVRERFNRYHLADVNDFHGFHERARKSLEAYWKNNTKMDIEIFPHACKLIDLHMKHIVWHRRDISKATQAHFLNSAFQPLDRYSLLFLRQCGVKSEGKEIPKNASMGFVDSEDKYRHFQASIREICQRANVPVFAFDHFAWNSGFSNESESYAP